MIYTYKQIKLNRGLKPAYNCYNCIHCIGFDETAKSWYNNESIVEFPLIACDSKKFMTEYKHTDGKEYVFAKPIEFLGSSCELWVKRESVLDDIKQLFM